jgi:hypothetical protein
MTIIAASTIAAAAAMIEAVHGLDQPSPGLNFSG